MPDLKWYWRRLAAMEPIEAAQRLRLLGWQWVHRPLAGRSAPAQAPDRWADAPPGVTADSEWVARLQSEAKCYLQHRWLFFNLGGRREERVDWHYDPLSGRRAPRVYAPDLDHRDYRRIGDAKVIWEKNRHHHLSLMAAAYAATGDARYSAEVAAQLADWVRENPYLIGINWTHGLECAIRLIAWVWCERLLRGAAHPAPVCGRGGCVWPAARDQQRFIAQTFSCGSSANNHLIGEAAGLFIAATAWPFFDASDRWRRRAQRILETEIIRQTFPSGLTREQAFGYHLFVTQFLLLALAEARRAGTDFSADYTARLRRMVEIIPGLADSGGHLPRYGDDDDGLALQLLPRDLPRAAWIYSAGRAWLGAATPPGAPLIFQSLENPAADFSNDWKPPAGSAADTDAGFYTLCSARGTPLEVFVQADAGPFGFTTIAAHAHADALAFTLSAGGHPILVDPGTGTYYADEEARLFFRGTRAHNTVVVDGQDQAISEGLFLWRKHTPTRVTEWKPARDGGALAAEHHGYWRLPGGVVHRRRLVLAGRRLRVEDEIFGTGEHRLEWYYHFDPACKVRLEENVGWVWHPGGGVRLELARGVNWTFERGGASAGWHSASFGDRTPAFCLRGAQRARLPFTAVTEIEVTE